MKMPKLCFVVLLVTLFGCAGSDPVRINVESDEAFEESLAEMQSSLSREERTGLMVALLRIRMAGLGSAKEAHSSIGGGQVLATDKMHAIDGLSYSEIMNLAELSDVKMEILK